MSGEQQSHNPVTRKMAALIDLAQGCSVHLTYRARRAPKGDCRECAHMWASRRELSRLADEYGVITGYTADRVAQALDAGMYLLVAGQFGNRLTAEQANDLKQHILGRLKAGEGA